jgi:Zn-dependent protease
MNPDLFAVGFLEYVIFLFSTTCHEAAHGLAAKWGGDTTALEAGQVSLNPLPHIRRELFGMVILPLLGIVSGTGLIGYASTPYDPKWSQQHPKRAAWMSLAGPLTNFTLAIISGVLMRIGLAVGSFVRAESSFTHIVDATSESGVMGGVAAVLSVMFYLNILLGAFNLIPVPPLDGYGILGLFTTENGALKLQEWRFRMGSMAIIGIVVAWQVFDRVFDPLLNFSLRMLFS